MAIIKIKFSLRINPEMYAKLKIIAKKDTRSVSNLIDYLIMQKIVAYKCKFENKLYLIFH